MRKRHGYSIAVDPTQKMLTSETESKIRWWGSLCECYESKIKRKKMLSA